MRIAIVLALTCGCTAPWQGPLDPAHWRQIGPYAYEPRGPNPECRVRGTEEYQAWLAPSSGLRASGARSDGVVGLAAGVETTLPVALDDNLRVGPWLAYGADTSALVHPRGGIVFAFTGMRDPRFMPALMGDSHEGVIELRLGAGWRAASPLAADPSDRGELDAIVAFGSRRHTEVVTSSIDYPSCHNTDAPPHRGHGGPGYAFGARFFVEVERSFDAATELLAGVEIDPVSMWVARRWPADD